MSSRPRCGRALVLASSSLLCLAGCFGSPRQLKVTEVSVDKIELYLDEPAGNRMTLQDHELLVTTATAATTRPTTRLSLGALGKSLQGGTFLVIYEVSGYRGAPEAADFTQGRNGDVAGIKVAENFFASLRDAAAVEVRVRGRHDRGMVYDRSDDCVRYGDPTTRPATGGAFYDADPAIIRQVPNSSGVSVQRRWNAGRPEDDDSERDLLLGRTTWGAPPL